MSSYLATRQANLPRIRFFHIVCDGGLSQFPSFCGEFGQTQSAVRGSVWSPGVVHGFTSTTFVNGGVVGDELRVFFLIVSREGHVHDILSVWQYGL